MTHRSQVACNGCRACCQNGEAIMLFPGDDASSYLTRDFTSPLDGSSAKALLQKQNGECIYLGAAGCQIYDRAPAICRTFDCAALYRKIMSWPKADRKDSAVKAMLAGPVLKAGRERA